MTIKLTHCDNCGEETWMEGSEYFHANGQKECKHSSFYNRMVATPVVTRKYTVLMHDGIGGGAMGPEFPKNGNQANSINEARRKFRQWLTDSGNDYTRAEGYGQPCAFVYLTNDWDGISYGSEFHFGLERGVRGGITLVTP
jgi:hypothetical protein